MTTTVKDFQIGQRVIVKEDCVCIPARGCYGHIKRIFRDVDYNGKKVVILSVKIEGCIHGGIPESIKPDCPVLFPLGPDEIEHAD